MTKNVETSAIVEFFKGKSVFITGATGCVGKQLVEKLVRSCPEIDHIYLLVRPKRGECSTDRLKKLWTSPLFDLARNINPKFEDMIVPMEGDILERNFGLKEADEWTLINNCHVVFHSAADTRFNESIQYALRTNVYPVKTLLTLCRKMKKLQSVVHVSTAYINASQNYTTEKVYELSTQPSKLLDAVECMDDEMLAILSKKLINDRSNTYIYSKALAEHLISEEANGIPVAIIRPSIVSSAWREPLPGWIDSYNISTALMVASKKGLLHVVLADSSAVINFVPVDICINMMIAIAWHTAMTHPKSIPVYNCCSGHLIGYTWGKMVEYGNHNVNTAALEDAISFPWMHLTNSWFQYYCLRIFKDLLRAYLLDFIMRLTGQKAIFIKLYHKINKSMLSARFVTSRSWIFPNDNSILLQNKMNKVDRQIFNFDTKDLEWSQYSRQQLFGIKQYLLQEDLIRTPKCVVRIQRLKYIQNLLWFSTITLLFIFLIYKFF